jgi:hypothetical protein
MKGAENFGIRVRSLYKRCGRCRHPRTVCPRLFSLTVVTSGALGLYVISTVRIVFSLILILVASASRAKGALHLGPCHLNPWDNDISHGSGGDRARSRRHRMMVAVDRHWLMGSEFAVWNAQRRSGTSQSVKLLRS